MKRFLLITLMAITAVALVAAPGWAAGGRKLSDRQLDSVVAGWGAVSDVTNASAESSSSSSGDLFIAGTASSAAAAVASDVGSALAVKINNKCDSIDCKLTVKTEVDGEGGSNPTSSTTNAQSILNTLASVNAVQVNVSAGGGTQENMAYSAEGAIGEIDSFETGAASANSAGVTGSLGSGTSFASADSSASAASSASSALAFATPRVEVKNRCAVSGDCRLKVKTEVEDGGVATTNAQSILNTVASVNAVQINVNGSGFATQTNIAYSTLK